MSASVESAAVPGFEEALEIVLRYCRRLPPPALEDIALPEAAGRVLAEPVLADRGFPPFPRATRDGYAVRASDLRTTPAALRVIGQIKAGAAFNRTVAAGEAAEIMTGASVPAGADAVVMVEYTSPQSGNGPGDVIVKRSVAEGENVVPAGAEAAAGQEILRAGSRLSAPQIAMAAAVGRARIKVYLPPEVAVLATGDELVELDRIPGPFQIRNSNSYSLAAQIRSWGGRPLRLPIAPDEPRKLSTLLRAGLAADMLLVTGGVSMGKFDLVEAALEELGAEFFFTGALIQPGRPVVFGEVRLSEPAAAEGLADGLPRTARGAISSRPVGVRRVPFFGLPGNPVSAMVCFELFARPLLEALGGAVPSRLLTARARLRSDIKTKTGLTRFLPAIVAAAARDGGAFDPEVEIVPWQGSGDLLASARANCYLIIPPDRDAIAAGEMVAVLLR